MPTCSSSRRRAADISDIFVQPLLTTGGGGAANEKGEGGGRAHSGFIGRKHASNYRRRPSCPAGHVAHPVTDHSIVTIQAAGPATANK